MIAVSQQFILFLDEDGKVRASGSSDTIEILRYKAQRVDTLIELDLPTKIKSISCGFRHCILVDEFGDVYGIGDGSSGQLGILGDCYTPQKIEDLYNIRSAKCGYFFTLCIDNSHKVHALGENMYGQLGIGEASRYHSKTPELVHLNDIDIQDIACGSFYSIFLGFNGLVYVCGKNNYGQLGIGSLENLSLPTKIDGLNNVKAIATGAAHSLFLTSDGILYGCGSNSQGAIGVGNTILFYHCPIKVNVPSNIEILSISAGYTHSMFIDSKYNLYAWGSNQLGQLGIGEASTISIPQKLPFSDVSVISSGGNNTVVKTLSDLYIFGPNQSSQCNIGISNSLTYCFRNPQKLDSNLYNIVGNPHEKRFSTVKSARK